MRAHSCAVIVSVLSVLVACGSFGAEDEDADPRKLEPSTPEDNAQAPPVDGTPIPGVYVSPSKGDDGGSGSPVRPLKTLRAAFALAKQQGLRVIACAERYEETVELVDGVSAYGYFDCNADPPKRGGLRAQIVASAEKPAIVAKGITLPTRIEGFEAFARDLDGAPATETSGTSIALEVRDAINVVFSEDLFHAGKGAPGVDGQPSAGNAAMTPGTVKGLPGVEQGQRSCNPVLSNCEEQLVPGPAGGTNQCMVGPSGGPGGAGGAGSWYSTGIPFYGPNPPGTRGLPLVGTAATAVGGLGGLVGTEGARGADGQDGANGTWSFNAQGFVQGNGAAGSNGEPGQGGGGGGGSLFYRINDAPASPSQFTFAASSTGGSGGAGGCPGLAGTPGTGGGASVGALVVNSDVAFERSRIEASSGGRAGRGNIGTSGTVGGFGGAAVMYAAKGGDGGAGGAGGVSGHGAPGPSIALAFSGVKPRLVETDLAPGAGGAGYAEERKTLGATVKVLPAVAGESKAEHVF